MARLTNHFENDIDTGGYTPIKHHDTPHNETNDENAPPQPPAHLIDPTSALCAPVTSTPSELAEALLASPAAGLAPPPSVASEAAGDDEAFSQIGSPRLSSNHSAKLSETLSSPRWSYENLRNQRWSYSSDVMERGVHDLKMLGKSAGGGNGESGHYAKNAVNGVGTKDEMNLTDSPSVLAASRAASSPEPLIDGPDYNNEHDYNNTSTTEQASPSNAHHDAPPSPLVLPQASLEDKAELKDEERTVADSDFTMRGLGPAIMESETEQEPAMVHDSLELSILHNPLMLSPQSYRSIMKQRQQDAKSDDFSASSGSYHSDATEQEASHNAPTSGPFSNASLEDKAELNDQDTMVADTDFYKRGLAPPIIESETEHGLQTLTLEMAQADQERKRVHALATSSTHHPDDLEQEATSNDTTSDATSHTHIPPLDTTEQPSTTAKVTSNADDPRTDSAVAADSPVRPKVTWDDQAPRTFASRRVSRDTFAVGQRRPSILLNGAAPSPTSTASTTSNGTTNANKHLASTTSTLANGNGTHKTTTTVAVRPGEYVVGTRTTSNAKLFVIMLLSMCGGYLVIRTVRELLGNWGVQGVLMVLGAALMMRRSV